MRQNLPLDLEEVELPIKFKDLLRGFGRHLALQKHRSARTQGAYLAWVAKTLSRFWERSPEEMDKHLLHLNEIRNQISSRSNQLEATSQAQWISSLRTFVKWISESSGLDVQKEFPKFEGSLILRDLRRPKISQRLTTVLDEEDLGLLLKFLSTRPPSERLLFELLYSSGLRISEVCALKLENLKPDLNELWIRGKGRKIRKVPLSPQAQNILDSLRFPWFGENPNPRKLRRIVANWSISLPLGEDGNLHLHPHKLRHSIATHLLRRGANLPQIQKFLGHTRLSTTQRYTHLRLEDLLKAYDACFPGQPSLRKRR